MRYINRLLWIFIIAMSAGCKNDNEKFADEQYQVFKSKITVDSSDGTAMTSAEFVAQFHYEDSKKREAVIWLNAYNDHMKQLELKENEIERKIQDKIDSLGGYRLIEIYTKTKCNLYEGTYQLKKEVKDSAALAFLAQYLAQQLFQNSKKKNDCSYPLMSQALIFQPNTKNRENWAAMCSITPSNYNGEIAVNKNINKD